MSFQPKYNPIEDDYIIDRKTALGEGISGKVFACKNRQTNEIYALKTLTNIHNPKVRRELDLHWRACQGSPYIVRIIDIYENTVNHEKLIYVILERLQGGELFKKIVERPARFTEQEVARMMFQICSAVKHLHSMGIAHRDLKPENLLLTTKGDNYIIKLTDFGFAKEANQGLSTPCYTPYYVAPEILGNHNDNYDKSCDIWSLGVIMYILCCGYPPFYSQGGAPISPGMTIKIRAGDYEFRDQEWAIVSDDAKNLIRSMLDTVPDRRATINDVMRSRWISQYVNVPQTPLPAIQILQEEAAQLPEINDAMNVALNEMRVDYDNRTRMKSLSEIVNNPILKRRNKK